VAAALEARPDLRAEVARGAAARQTGSAIRAERLPRLDLEADYGVNGLTMPSAISTRQVALQVTVPILDGFRREARIAEQNAAVSESRVRERDLRQQIAAEVDAALLDSRSAEAQQVVAAERLRLAADELAQARERFKAGVGRPPPAAGAAPAASPGGRRRTVFLIMGVVLLGLVGFGARRWWFNLSHVSTDNAQVDGHIIPILPKVGGFVALVRTDDNRR